MPAVAADQLIPPDPLRCQVEWREGSFMTFGPRGMIRCKSKPVVIATEIEIDPKYAKAGQMSMCAEHWKIYQEKYPGKATFEPITSTRRTRGAR